MLGHQIVSIEFSHCLIPSHCSSEDHSLQEREREREREIVSKALVIYNFTYSTPNMTDEVTFALVALDLYLLQPANKNSPYTI